MSKKFYVELNCMTQFSLNDSTLTIDTIVNETPSGGRVALTDINHTGAFTLADKFYKKDINPIFGLSIFVKSSEPRMGQNILAGSPFNGETNIQGENIVLLAKDNKAIQNLYKITSLAKNSGENYTMKTASGSVEIGEHISIDDIKPYSEGLICLTGMNQSYLNKEIYDGMTDDKAAEINSEKKLAKLIEIFGKDNTIIQLFQTVDSKDMFKVRNNLSDEDADMFYEDAIYSESKVVRNLLHLIKKFDLEFVWARGTNHTEKMAKLNEFIYQRYFSDNQFYTVDVDKFQHSLYSEEIFKKAIENTSVIADRCQASITFGEYEEIPYIMEDGFENPREFVSSKIKLVFDQYSRKHNLDEEQLYNYNERIKFEMSVIDEMVAQRNTDFFAYFYFVQDYINFCKSDDIERDWKKFFPNKTKKQILEEGELLRERDAEGNFTSPNPFLSVVNKKREIFVGPGRGSAGGSLICFLLGITDIDPMIYGGIMGRFLNPKRATMPDIDTDFEMLQRAEVLKYFQAKYGYERVGRFYTLGIYKPKSSMSKCLRLVNADKQLFNLVVSKEISDEIGAGDYKNTSLKDVIVKGSPVYSQLLDEFYSNGNKEFEYITTINGKNKKFKISNFKEAFDYACELCGLHSNESVHASAFVVTAKPLIHFGTIKEEYVDGVKVNILTVAGEPGEAIGILKFDILGLQTLDIIHRSLDLIEANHGIKLSIGDIPLNDLKTYQLLAEGDTIGVFQFENPGMAKTLMGFMEGEIEGGTSPERLFELGSITTSAYRPGPMEFIPEMLDVKHGDAQIDPDYPDFVKKIVKNTFGIMIYQEQIMQVYQAMGATEGEADILRKGAGKKNLAVMSKIEPDFRSKAKAMGVTDAVATKLWNAILKFAGYGFNKAHADEYTMISVKTAWLKANYRAEFLQAALNLAVFYDEETGKKQNHRETFAKLMGHVNQDYTIQAPLLEFSQSEVILSDKYKTCTIGLSSVPQCARISQDIIRAREKYGKFINFADLFVKANLSGLSINKGALDNLIISGACDSLIEEFFSIKFDSHNMKDVLKYRNIMLRHHKNLSKLNKFIKEYVNLNESISEYQTFVENYKDLFLFDQEVENTLSIGSPQHLINYEMKNFGVYITFDLFTLMDNLGSSYDGEVGIKYGIFTEELKKFGDKYKLSVQSNKGIFQLSQKKFNKQTDLNRIVKMEIDEYAGHIYAKKQENQKVVPVNFHFFEDDQKEEANIALSKFAKTKKRNNINEVNIIHFKNQVKTIFN